MILTIVGARPQFIKAAPVSKALKNAGIKEYLVHTGQHYDKNMSQVFFDELEIPEPDVNLKVGCAQAFDSHARMTAEMMMGIELEIVRHRPKMVLVYGDTNSTLAGALTAAKLNIPVVHVEAGLRSFNMSMPEEVNRVLTDHVSKFLFCPSVGSVNNLRDENIKGYVKDAGDVMYDVFMANQHRYKDPYQAPHEFILATVHRADLANDEKQLKHLFAEFAKLPLPVVIPLHPRLKAWGSELPKGKKLHIIEPVSYLRMLGYLKHCACVITDSGGLQKEAYFSGKRCLILRNETEWTELVHWGASRLVGPEFKNVKENVTWAMNPVSLEDQFLYGQGDAAEKIVAILKEHL